jgi:hypothetical protein
MSFKEFLAQFDLTDDDVKVMIPNTGGGYSELKSVRFEPMFFPNEPEGGNNEIVAILESK